MMLKLKILIMLFSVKIFNLGVSQCTSCHVTGQNINFTKIAFSLSILLIEASGLDQKIDKIHTHHSVIILAQIDALLVMLRHQIWILLKFTISSVSIIKRVPLRAIVRIIHSKELIYIVFHFSP